MEEHGGLPSFVRDEFEAYLQCGRLECGFPSSNAAGLVGLAAFGAAESGDSLGRC